MVNHDLQPGPLNHCQICGAEDLELVLNLGHHPPCDSLLSKNQLHQLEKTYPLRFLHCRHCGLAQIDYAVAPEELFYADYPYRSGITGTLSRNLQSIGEKFANKLSLKMGSLVIDIGSNDGTLLQGFQAHGMKVLGIEPTNVAKIAIKNGIPTVQAFFSKTLAKKIRQEHGPASVVTAANMFAHVAKLSDLILGVEEMLVDEGMFLTESHYLIDLIETVQYDSIYHEHLKYYSLQSMMYLFDNYDFTVVDAERIPNYGGSIRVYAKKGKGHHISERLRQLLQAEKSILENPDIYAEFSEKVIKSKLDLQTLLLDLKKQDKRVVGIGCPGRASTLLNYANIDPDLMPYIAEQSTSLKLGLFLPGQHIPIVDEKIMFEENPEYAVMLSWHYAAPIIKKLRKKGLKSKIIIPLPEVHILED